jgi:hypothetical protein
MLPFARVRITLISRHLLGQLLGATLLGALLLCALVFLLQALRLGHHLAASGSSGAALLGRALLLSAPSLLTFSLPLAAAGAVLLVFARLADTQQLTALEAAGASPLQLASPVLQQLLLAALVTVGLGRWVEPTCLERLQGRLVREAGLALLAGLRPGQFLALSPELTVHAEARASAAPGEVQIDRLFLAHGRPPQQLVARRARLHVGDGAVLEAELEDGELRAAGSDGPLEQVRFGRARLSFSLAEGLRPHLLFLEARRREAPQRAVRAAAGGLALGLLALLIGSRVRSAGGRGLLGLCALAIQQCGLLIPGSSSLAFMLGLAALALLALLARRPARRITSPG